MSIDEILNAIDDLLSKHEGDELALMEALDSKAEGWRMRREELEDEQDDKP